MYDSLWDDIVARPVHAKLIDKIKEAVQRIETSPTCCSKYARQYRKKEGSWQRRRHSLIQADRKLKSTDEKESEANLLAVGAGAAQTHGLVGRTILAAKSILSRSSGSLMAKGAS